MKRGKLQLLGAAVKHAALTFDQLSWAPISTPFADKAVINAQHFVIRNRLNPAAPLYNVFKDNVGMEFNIGLTETEFKSRLNAGNYGTAGTVNPGVILIPGTNTGGPATPIPPRTPTVDPVGPSSSAGTGFMGMSNTTLLIAGLAIIGLIYFLKTKK